MKVKQRLANSIVPKGLILLLVVISSFLGGAVSNWIFGVQPVVQAEEKKRFSPEMLQRVQPIEQETEKKTKQTILPKTEVIIVPPNGLEFQTPDAKILAKLWSTGAGGQFSIYDYEGREHIRMNGWRGIDILSPWTGNEMVEINFAGDQNKSSGIIIVHKDAYDSASGRRFAFETRDKASRLLWNSSQ